MLTFASTCMLVTCLLAVYVGVRTLSVWRGTRKVPELAIGLNVLGIALGGALLVVFKVPAAVEAGEVWARPLFAVTILALALHVVALFGGNWRIFRPADRWSVSLFALAVALTGGWAVSMWIAPEPNNARSMLFEALRAAGMAWASIESFRYSAMLRRRVALGLANPMIAHRIRLWGYGAGCQVVAGGMELSHRVVTGTSIFLAPVGLIVSATLGLVGIVCVSLAFFPPQAYERLVSGRAAGEADQPVTS